MPAVARFQSAGVNDELAGIRRLDGEPGLVGPSAFDSEDGSVPSPRDAGAVTGSGLVAWIDREAGLTGLWSGRGRLAQTIRVSVDGTPAIPTGFFWGRGGWSGTRTTSSGVTVREIGLLPDVATACVLQWTVETHASGAARVVHARLDGETGPSVALPLGPEGRVLVVVSRPGESVSLPRLTPVAARERQRHSRHRTHGKATRIRLNDRTDGELDAAIRTLEESPLGDPARPGVTLFLDDFEGGRPRFCQPRNLGLLGHSALAFGLQHLARCCLERLSADPGAAPTALLGLAADYFGWTGDGAFITSLETALREAVLGMGSPNSPVGLRALSRLETAIEPLGLSGLRAAAKAHRSSLGSSGASSRDLPTVAATGDRASEDVVGLWLKSDSLVADLVPPEGSTRSAVRRLGVWELEHLRIRPEAVYGRVVFSPRFDEETARLEVSDLPVGDSDISLSLSRKGSEFELRATQSRGRVPLNLACEPWFPTVGLREVRIDGEPADVQASDEAGGTRVRFQLPLDSERRIRFSFENS